jgi:quercetin dioxygenase-like cupin family protein
MNDHVEIIASPSGQQLAYIVRAAWRPTATEFVTPDTFSLQMGMIVYSKGKEIPAHMHLPIVREVHGTNEVVSVRSGDCEVDLYDDQRVFVASRRLTQGDIVLLLGGGHGFRMNEDTVLFEVKQGPYAGGRDKERF